MGTTGRWEVSPNAVNSVPRVATLEVAVTINKTNHTNFLNFKNSGLKMSVHYVI